MDHISPEKLGSVSIDVGMTDAKEVVKDLRAFQDAIAAAQLGGDDFIQVDEKVFNYFMKGKPGEYFSYGAPSVRVYLEGKKEISDEKESRIIL